jgi:hypothetical protein
VIEAFDTAISGSAKQLWLRVFWNPTRWCSCAWGRIDDPNTFMAMNNVLLQGRKRRMKNAQRHSGQLLLVTVWRIMYHHLN